MMNKILIVEDDVALQQTLTAVLEAENYQVCSANDGGAGFDLALKENPDLIVLDMMLPSLNGLDVLRQLREKGLSTPVIFLSGQKMEETDKVLGLELGADDYMLKPFGTREFLARVRAVLRRGRPLTGESSIETFAFGNIRIDFEKQTVTKMGRDVDLTAKETKLLKFLIAHEGRVMSRDTILNQVWGYETFPTTRTVDTFIHNLRKKIEDDPSKPRHILTVPWSGYKFKK